MEKLRVDYYIVTVDMLP